MSAPTKTALKMFARFFTQEHGVYGNKWAAKESLLTHYNQSLVRAKKVLDGKLLAKLINRLVGTKAESINMNGKYKKYIHSESSDGKLND